MRLAPAHGEVFNAVVLLMYKRSRKYEDDAAGYATDALSDYDKWSDHGRFGSLVVGYESFVAKTILSKAAAGELRAALKWFIDLTRSQSLPVNSVQPHHWIKWVEEAPPFSEYVAAQVAAAQRNKPSSVVMHDHGAPIKRKFRLD
jgi:hypothetical protein